MGTLMVTGTAQGGASSARRKPKRALRGRRRHAVQRLRHYCQIVQRMDDAEQKRADKLGYVPYLFTIRPGANEAKALANVEKRCATTLAATLQ